MYAEKILVVDDDPLVLKMVSETLARNLFDVWEAEDAKEALRVLKEEKIELIVLDHMLPDISGLDFCRNLKQIEQFKDIPVIMFSCCTAFGFETECEKAGAMELIPKTSYTNLIARLKEIFRSPSLA